MSKVISFERLWNRFGFSGLEPEEFKKRTSAVNAAIFTVLAGLIHSLIYVALGFPYVTIAVISYASCSVANLLYLRSSQNFNKFRNIQLWLISFFPFVTQLFIGGFINGSAVALAGFIAPATALMYTTSRRARSHYYLFATLVIIASVWDIYFVAGRIELPSYITSIFFAVNIVATLGIIYFLMESFLKKQEELRRELKESLEHLKATQKQLIQSEKMASLGQLTAGIAHEIQNPLNFVNNFSDLSRELIDEMNGEIDKGEFADAKQIATDLKQILEKLHHHGKRAESIVKGMLEHSRIGSGIKEPTDINKICDEFVRLAYHGLRAKDKSFNAEINTDFDEKIGKMNLVGQDVGRVILNILNNAFYAVNERSKKVDNSYKPAVSVSTKLLISPSGNRRSVISVSDNGGGIPEEIREKIFQPFFTTKPTGQGTGLGLSLCYDIVKAHGGDIQLDSREGKGTSFIIELPFTS